MSCKTLEEMIKILPDDMIIKIKGYVINPYKFIPELKLYKLPHYTYRISTVFNNWVLETINDMCFERHFYLELFHAMKALCGVRRKRMHSSQQYINQLIKDYQAHPL